MAHKLLTFKGIFQVKWYKMSTQLGICAVHIFLTLVNGLYLSIIFGRVLIYCAEKFICTFCIRGLGLAVIFTISKVLELRNRVNKYQIILSILSGERPSIVLISSCCSIKLSCRGPCCFIIFVKW